MLLKTNLEFLIYCIWPLESILMKECLYYEVLFGFYAALIDVYSMNNRLLGKIE